MPTETLHRGPELTQRRVERLLLWLRAKVSERREIGGVVLLATDAGILDRVADAIALIGRYDPVRYGRLVADVDRIWVEASTGPSGWFEPATWTIWLNELDVVDEKTGIEQIAATIVHEATHARFLRAGIGYDESIRVRVERACIRREHAFASRVPGGIDGLWPEDDFDRLPDYSDAAVTDRYRRRVLDDLEMLGAPRWLTAALSRLRVAKDRIGS